jgi:NitT/TauT family transport system substrate-binding protein
MTMMKYRIDRRKTLGLLGGTAAAYLMPVPGARVSAQTLDKISFQTNWRAEAEHGGYYYAVANGIYKKLGLDADIRMGGPQQNPSQMLLGGAVDMIMSNGIEAINYVKENLPFLCIASIFQKDPQVLISHPGVGHDTLGSLKGSPVYIGAASRTSYWPFLRKKFGFTDDMLRPYTFQMAPFLADKNVSQQGFVTSEPYVIMKAGVKPVIHLLADSGYGNYQTTMHVSRKMVQDKKDVVQRFINGTLEGWAEYLKASPANASADALIKKENPDMDDAQIAFSLKAMNDNGIVHSGDALKLGIGAMTDARWKSFYDIMSDVDVFPKNLDVTKAYSLDFVNKGIGA